MKPKTIEIYGTGTHNRGAELMAIACAQRLRERYPDICLVVNRRFGSAKERARYGFLTTWEAFGRLASVKAFVFRLLSLIDRSVVAPSQVDVILDASGFAFSDQWGSERARILLAHTVKSARRTKPLILLPQALGPFESADVSDAAQSLFGRALRVYARDDESFQYASRLSPKGVCRKAPDFTIGLAPASVPFELPLIFGAIVPNEHMLGKRDNPESYLRFLRHVVLGLEKRGILPIFVLHDSSHDRRVIDDLGEFAEGYSVVTHTDPLVLKGVLARASVVVGSRFHALVSAFSAGVPCIGAGWSHKYPELFRDFGCDDLLVSNLDDELHVDTILDRLSDDDECRKIRQVIYERGAALKRNSNLMWEDVFKLIDGIRLA